MYGILDSQNYRLSSEVLGIGVFFLPRLESPVPDFDPTRKGQGRINGLLETGSLNDKVYLKEQTQAPLFVFGFTKCTSSPGMSRVE